jgi:hypothetical protein
LARRRGAIYGMKEKRKHWGPSYWQEYYFKWNLLFGGTQITEKPAGYWRNFPSGLWIKKLPYK